MTNQATRITTAQHFTDGDELQNFLAEIHERPDLAASLKFHDYRPGVTVHLTAFVDNAAPDGYEKEPSAFEW